MTEQAIGGGGERNRNGWGPRPSGLDAANQQKDKQQAHADHRAGQGQVEGAGEEFAQQLAQKNAGEGGDHGVSRKWNLPSRAKIGRPA